MKLKSNTCSNTNIVFSILLFSILINYFIFPSRIYIQLFTCAYIVLIYKKFTNNLENLLYYSTILLAIINFSMEIPITSRYSIYYFYVTLFVYMVGVIIYIVKERKNIEIKNLIKSKYTIFLVVFILYMIATLFISESKKMAIKYIYNFFIMVSLTIMICFHNKNNNDFKNMFKFLNYLFIGILMLGCLEIFGVEYGVRNHFSEWDPVAANIDYVKHIPVTFFYNPNNYAVFLVLGMTLLFLAFLFSKNRKEKIVYSIIYFIAQINLIFTRSRTAWISIFLIVLFCIGFYMLKFKINKIKILKLTSILLATLIFFGCVSVIPTMKPYYGKFSTSKLFKFKKSTSEKKEPVVSIGKKGSDNQRFTLMYDVIDGVIINKNYLGLGPGNIEKYVEKKDNTYGVYNVHSLWFEFLGNFGIGMFIYFLYIYLGIIIKNLILYNRTKYKDKKYFIMGSSLIFGFIFLSFAPSSIMWYTPFWICLGIAIRTTFMKTENVNF